MREKLFFLGLLGFATSFSQELDRAILMAVCSSIIILHSLSSKPKEQKKVRKKINKAELNKDSELIVIEVN